MTSSKLSSYVDIIHKNVSPLVPQGATLALMDFPNYGNVGDSAIWLGELDYFRTYRPDCKISWVSDASMVEWGALPCFSENTVILLNGGGNLGDLWSMHQRHRQRVISYYLRNTIIQLPQSIHFENQENWNACSEVFSGHPSFFLMVRDRESWHEARRLNDGRAYLCPDMALAMGGLERSSQPVHDCLALLRTDQEAVEAERVTSAERPMDVHVTDWRAERDTLAMRVNRVLTRYPRRTRLLRPFIYERLARERLRRGCRLLESGRVVITDRLHAHLLCTLLGIPHVVLDNCYRKIGRFRDVWNTGEGLCQTASSLEEAEALAAGLVQGEDGG